jgi:hypothetical protein
MSVTSGRGWTEGKPRWCRAEIAFEQMAEQDARIDSTLESEQSDQIAMIELSIDVGEFESAS